jgi:hypothetical protein
MAVTSLIKPVQNKKGIFYNFQSALEDINITLSNSENAVRFSKFVLLRVPEIGEPDTLQTDNKIQFYSQGETPLIEGLNTDNNVNLAQSFQNYALNLEALLLSRPQYKKDEKLTVSERVFWKWIKELGAIRFQDANTLEKNFTILGTGPGSERFVEKPETNSTYKRVVKYVGDIDVVNSLKNNNNSYTEIYIHVPSNVGTTPHVLFKSIKDANYYPSMTIANIGADPLNIEYLAGRKYNEVHPFGLSLKAFYDLDSSEALAQIKNSFTAVYSAGNWFNKTVKNAYYTDVYLDPTTGSPSPDPVSGDTNRYNVAKDQFVFKQVDLKSVEYVRTTLDGISIDFDLNNYKLASENAEIKVFSQFNDYVANRDFEFNAILIYYDTYDPNNLDSNGVPVDFKTNLYGVLFLDRIQQSGLEFQIPTILKYKQDPLNKVNGNAFSFKLNLKLDSSIEDALVERSINDYSTFSLELFTDVLTEFKQLQQRYNDKLLELDKLRQDVENLKGLLLNTEDQTELANRVSNLETSLTANSAIFENTAALINLITSVNDKVDSIVTGTTNAKVSYDIDAVRPGEGIAIDRRTPGRIRVVNSNQQYNIANSSIGNIFNNNVVTLSTFTNYLVHQNSGAPIVLEKDLQVFITDYPTYWKKGQTLRLVFDDELVLGNYNLKFYTDYTNRQSLGQYGVQIGVIIADEFTSSDNKPIFDIICMNENTLSFRIDKIR